MRQNIGRGSLGLWAARFVANKATRGESNCHANEHNTTSSCGYAIFRMRSTISCQVPRSRKDCLDTLLSSLQTEQPSLFLFFLILNFAFNAISCLTNGLTRIVMIAPNWHFGNKPAVVILRQLCEFYLLMPM